MHFLDPEEFLNFLLKKVLVTTPYLEIRYVNAIKTHDSESDGQGK